MVRAIAVMLLAFAVVGVAEAQEVTLISRVVLEAGVPRESPWVAITNAERFSGKHITLDPGPGVLTDPALRMSITVEMLQNGEAKPLATVGIVGGAHYADGSIPSFAVPDIGQADAEYRVRMTSNIRARVGIKFAPLPPE